LRAATIFDLTDWPPMLPRTRQRPASPPPLPSDGGPRPPARNEPTGHFRSRRGEGREPGEGHRRGAKRTHFGRRPDADRTQLEPGPTSAQRTEGAGAKRTDGPAIPAGSSSRPRSTKRTQRGNGQAGQAITPRPPGAERTQRPARPPSAPNEPNNGVNGAFERISNSRSRLLGPGPARRETNPLRPPAFDRTNPPRAGAKRTQRGVGGFASRLRSASRPRGTNRTSADRSPAPNEPTGHWDNWGDRVGTVCRRRTNPPIRFVHNEPAGPGNLSNPPRAWSVRRERSARGRRGNAWL
jgi:hypothetical protein